MGDKSLDISHSNSFIPFIRQLKADKASKDEITDAVAKLKALKLEAEAPKDEEKPAVAADGEDEVYSDGHSFTASFFNPPCL